MATYPVYNGMPVVPAADLISLTAKINVKGPGRVSSAATEGVGKRFGTMVIRDSGTGDKYSIVFATGSAAADVWLAADGATKYTPV